MWKDVQRLRGYKYKMWVVGASCLLWRVSFFKPSIVNCARRRNWALMTPKMHWWPPKYTKAPAIHMALEPMALFIFPNRLSGHFKEMYSATSCWNLFYTAMCNKYMFRQLPQGQIMALAFLLWCSLAIHLALLRSPSAQRRSDGEATCSSKGKWALLLPCSGTRGSLGGSPHEYPLLLVMYCTASAYLICCFSHYSCPHVLFSSWMSVTGLFSLPLLVPLKCANEDLCGINPIQGFSACRKSMLQY